MVGLAAPLALLLRETEGRESARPGLAEIARLVRSHRLVAIPLLFAFADRFTVGFFTSTFPLFLRNLHELPPPRIGILIAVFMLPFAALSIEPCDYLTTYYDMDFQVVTTSCKWELT